MNLILELGPKQTLALNRWPLDSLVVGESSIKRTKETFYKISEVYLSVTYILSGPG